MNNKWIYLAGGLALGYFVLPMLLVHINGLFSKG